MPSATIDILPHVTLLRDSHEVTLRVEDTELFDMIEDHLTETAGLEANCLRMERHGALFVYYATFLLAQEPELRRALEALTPDRVEAVFRLNNA